MSQNRNQPTPLDYAHHDFPHDYHPDICGQPVEGSQEIKEALDSLVTQAKHEVVTLAPGGAHTKEEIEAAESRSSDAVRTGVHARTIFLTTVRNDANTMRHIKWLNEIGEEVRTAPALPIRMVIFDRKIAVLPLNMLNAMNGIIIYRNSSVVVALQQLFEITWAAATPIGEIYAPDGKKISNDEQVLLQLIAIGNTDAQISKRLSIPDRDIRRRIQSLQKRFGANSRMNTVYRAAKMGLI